MSTVVCRQGLKSCLESQVLETTVRLKLAAPKSLEFGSGPLMLDTDTHSGEKQLGSWSFLQLLSNVSHQGRREETGRGNAYVHPLSNRSSSSRLSGKSLELCTENLGSETGTDINTTEESNFSSASLLTTDNTSSCTDEIKLPEKDKKRRQLRTKIKSRKVHPRTFPPPLTTISGSNSLRVRSHREGGRLIIKAEQPPSKHTYLQAERSNGRLRLSFVRNYASNIGSDETNEENGAGNVINYKNEDEINPCENDSNYGEEQEEENIEESNEEEEGGVEDDDENDSDVCRRKDIDGNSFDTKVEKGMDKFRRPSRCKEDGHGNNKGLCNWEHLCVATS